MRKFENFDKQNRLLLLFKVLSNANRLKVIKYLSEQHSATPGQMSLELKISECNLSNHLKLMRISKVVKAKQQGSFLQYSIKDPLVTELISSIRR